MRLPEAELTTSKLELKPTAELLASRTLEDRAELQWRLSMPIMAFVLTLLAVPLVAPATPPGTLRAHRSRDPPVFRLHEPAVRGEGLAGTRHASLRRWACGGCTVLMVACRASVLVHERSGCDCGPAAGAGRHEESSIATSSRTILLYSAMVLGALLTLGALFVFIGQQDDIGVGSYGRAMRCCSRCSICRSRPSS